MKLSIETLVILAKKDTHADRVLTTYLHLELTQPYMYYVEWKRSSDMYYVKKMSYLG